MYLEDEGEKRGMMRLSSLEATGFTKAMEPI
jgi:hypothetical protein